MRTVVVPLDGTVVAEGILPDARRLAGSHGTLILIHDASIVPYYGLTYIEDQRQAVRVSRDYLHEVAEKLRGEGVEAQTQTTLVYDAALAVDEVVMKFHADMVAVGTHARGSWGRLFRGSVALRVLTNSPVPVLLRHTEKDDRVSLQPPEPRILVPLDGSILAEKALPLAQQLAREWNSAIWLALVVLDTAVPPRGAELNSTWIADEVIEPQKREAEAYLREVAAKLQGQAHMQVLLGSPVDELVAAAEAWGISDVVLASHGRTGLSRAILGSVADALIQHLNLPIIVIPAQDSRPAQTLTDEKRSKSGPVPA